MFSCGDLNLKLLDPTHPHSIKLDEILKSFRRTRLLTGPTHISGGILDFVIVSLDLQLPNWTPSLLSNIQIIP